MFPKFVALLPASKQSLNIMLSRNVAASSVLMKNDPIQQLFLDKSKEYYKKKAASKSGLIEMSAEMQKQLNDELEKINKLYGSSANNEFPTFNFSEPKLDGIHADKLEAHN